MRFTPSEGKATTAATCLISSCLPGRRRASFNSLTGGMTGPIGPPRGMPPAPLRPRPPRPPPPPASGELLWLAAGALNWAAIRRCASSLSASLSCQTPLKSTPGGGACASFSLAQAARHITDTTTISLMPEYYNEAQAGRYSAESARRTSARGEARSLRPANPDTALEGLEAHPQRLGPTRGLGAAGDFAVGEVRFDQIDQSGAGLSLIRRRQSMRAY